jgi:hypothetical protein
MYTDMTFPMRWSGGVNTGVRIVKSDRTTYYGNNSGALLAAIAALQTGDTLLIGSCTFDLGAVLPTIAVDNVRIIGAGKSTVLSRVAASATGYILSLANRTGITIEDVTFDGLSGSQTIYNGINVSGTTDCTLRRCRFINWGNLSTYGAIRAETDCTNIRIHACESTGSTSFALRGSRVHVTDCLNLVGTYIRITSATSDLFVVGNNFYSTTGLANSRLHVTAAVTRATVVGNHFIGDLASHDVNAGLIDFRNVDNRSLVITGNTCYRGQYGISVHGQGHTITGNICTYNRDDGIRIDCDHSVIAGNTSSYNDYSGIFVEEINEGVHASNNNIYGNTCVGNLIRPHDDQDAGQISFSGTAGVDSAYDYCHDNVCRQGSTSNVLGNITAVDTTAKTFTVAGDHVTGFMRSDNLPYGTITVLGGANAGEYAATNAVYSAGSTVITVSNAIPSAVVEGSIRRKRVINGIQIGRASAGEIADHHIVTANDLRLGWDGVAIADYGTNSVVTPNFE